MLPLLAQVPSAVVHNDPKPAGRLPPNTRLLELRKREPTSLTQLGVVAHGRRADGGAEGLERAHAERGGFSLACLAAAELAAGLVEPGAHAALPVLVEVPVGEDCMWRMR